MTQLYHDKVTDLFDEYYTASQDAKPEPIKRIDASNSLVEEYIDQHGKRPPNAVLSRLSTYILLDTLSDSHPDKMSREEYPIMSYGQTGRYFARNGKLADVPYDYSEVVGRTSTAVGDGNNADSVILNPETSDQKATNWRLFLRDVLTDRESLVIERTYEDGATQAEIAEELGVSRQRVSAILAEVYGKLSEVINR